MGIRLNGEAQKKQGFRQCYGDGSRYFAMELVFPWKISQFNRGVSEQKQRFSCGF